MRNFSLLGRRRMILVPSPWYLQRYRTTLVDALKDRTYGDYLSHAASDIHGLTVSVHTPRQLSSATTHVMKG
jgi:hypothetical protein